MSARLRYTLDRLLCEKCGKDSYGIDLSYRRSAGGIIVQCPECNTEYSIIVRVNTLVNEADETALLNIPGVKNIEFIEGSAQFRRD
jgi:RNase P subunit RPR2